ncbi:MAG: hypothetical protein NTY38_11135 [Acidobacteria bacterium]|nr:hypothetical protein [Acidobacteriota bacterium]
MMQIVRTSTAQDDLFVRNGDVLARQAVDAASTKAIEQNTGFLQKDSEWTSRSRTKEAAQLAGGSFCGGVDLLTSPP